MCFLLTILMGGSLSFSCLQRKFKATASSYVAQLSTDTENRAKQPNVSSKKIILTYKYSFACFYFLGRKQRGLHVLFVRFKRARRQIFNMFRQSGQVLPPSSSLCDSKSHCSPKMWNFNVGSGQRNDQGQACSSQCQVQGILQGVIVSQFPAHAALNLALISADENKPLYCSEQLQLSLCLR